MPVFNKKGDNMGIWEFRHLGVEVKDLDSALEHFGKLGFTPTSRPEVVAGSHSYMNFKMYGKTPETEIKTRLRFVKKGSMLFELLQPLEGYSLHNEFQDEKSEGISHICFTVDDFDGEVDELVKQGFPVILSGETSGGSRFAYVDAREIGGLIFEMVSRP